MFWNVRPMPRFVIVCGGGPTDLLPSKRIAPAVGLYTPVSMIEEGRLAGAVRADEADDRPARDREVDVVDCDEAAELLAEPWVARSEFGHARPSVVHGRRSRASLELHVVNGVSSTLSISMRATLGDEPCGPEEHHATMMVP